MVAALVSAGCLCVENAVSHMLDLQRMIVRAVTSERDVSL
jgi:hypothetical protein